MMRGCLPRRTATVLADGRFNVQPGEALAAYGVERLTCHGWTLRVPQRKARGVAKKVRDIIEHRTGILVENALRGALRPADLVVCLLENHAEFCLRLRRLGVPPYRDAKIVVLVCWETERMRHMGRSQLERRVALLNRADILFVLSSNQIDELVQRGIARSKIVAVPFGVEVKYFTPGLNMGERHKLVAIGQDRGRDYTTLCDALRGTGTTVDLYCGVNNIDVDSLPPEVVWRGKLPRERYRDVLQHARAVIVPTHELAYPTGQSVALEAMACGAGVIASRTVALSEYFVDGESALLADVGDPASLRAQIEVASSANSATKWERIAAEGMRLCREQYTTDRMWDKMAPLLAHGRQHGHFAEQPSNLFQ